MFLALVLLLGHGSAPAASKGPLDGSGSLSGASQGSLREVPADVIKALGPVRRGEAIVVSNATTSDDNEPSIAFSQNGKVISVPHRVLANGHRRWLVAAVMPVDQTKGSPTVTEGVATGPWQIAGAVELKQGLMAKRTGQGFVRMVRPDEKRSGKKPTQLVVVDAALPTDLLQNAYRVQVIDKDGKSLTQTGSTAPTASGDQSLVFEGDFSSTSRVVLQQRPLKWLTKSGR